MSLPDPDLSWKRQTVLNRLLVRYTDGIERFCFLGGNRNAISGKYIMGDTLGASSSRMVGGETPARGYARSLDTNWICWRTHLRSRLWGLMAVVILFVARQRRLDHKLVR